MYAANFALNILGNVALANDLSPEGVFKNALKSGFNRITDRPFKDPKVFTDIAELQEPVEGKHLFIGNNMTPMVGIVSHLVGEMVVIAGAEDLTIAYIDCKRLLLIDCHRVTIESGKITDMAIFNVAHLTLLGVYCGNCFGLIGLLAAEGFITDALCVAAENVVMDGSTCQVLGAYQIAASHPQMDTMTEGLTLLQSDQVFIDPHFFYDLTQFRTLYLSDYMNTFVHRQLFQQMGAFVDAPICWWVTPGDAPTVDNIHDANKLHKLLHGISNEVPAEEEDEEDSRNFVEKAWDGIVDALTSVRDIVWENDEERALAKQHSAADEEEEDPETDTVIPEPVKMKSALELAPKPARPVKPTSKTPAAQAPKPSSQVVEDDEEVVFTIERGVTVPVSKPVPTQGMNIVPIDTPTQKGGFTLPDDPTITVEAMGEVSSPAPTTTPKSKK